MTPRAEFARGATLWVLALMVAGSAAGQPIVEVPAPRASEPAASALGRHAADLLARAIRIPTANPPGAERALARLFVDELSNAGVEARVVPTPSTSDAPRAAAWARVRGNGTARPLILLSHLDVVPARAEDWSVDPFAGVVEGGFVIGRGALDAKGVAVIHLLTLLELARRPTPLDRDIIFLATPDEESGGEQGAAHLVRERPDLFEKAEFLLTEGGGIHAAANGAPAIWGVSVTEKSPCWLELRARGEAGHSSAPRPGAAVPRLVAALDRVRRVESPVRVVPEVARMFDLLSAVADDEDRWGYSDLARSLEGDPAFRRRFLSNPGRRALTRDTVAITVLAAGERTNVIPAEARAQLDARLLPGSRCEDFRRAIVDVIADPAVEVTTKLSFTSGSSSPHTPLFRAIVRVAGAVDPGALVVPRMIAGFTDAHWFRDAGIVAYGFVPRWLAAGDARGVHGVDERVSIANLERGVTTLTKILEQLQAAP